MVLGDETNNQFYVVEWRYRAQGGLGAVAAARGIYDTARTIYSVGQAIAPYAGAAALAFV